MKISNRSAKMDAIVFTHKGKRVSIMAHGQSRVTVSITTENELLMHEWLTAEELIALLMSYKPLTPDEK